MDLNFLMEWIITLRQRYSKDFQRVWFDTPVLRTPEWQSMQILPDHYVSKLESLKEWMETHLETEENRFHGFKDYEIQRMDRDIAWMRQGTDNVEQKKADFYRFFTEADKRHGTAFLEVFPELEVFWNECKYYASR